ncbi:MAG: UDP-N-acetylglucosamine 2-epimerase [Phycisphaerales bacterium]
MSARRIAIVTGTRAEYGLLRTVIRACDARSDLETHVLATGTHLLPPAMTIEEVERECDRVRRVPMQKPGETGRLDDARALGRGIEGMADAIDSIEPEVVLVLGDRIEALAGASAASVGGVICAHVHGGDRAEGVADEAMRHAITKLAHLHLPATEQSAERIRAMGEDEWRVHAVGSPAIDGLDAIAPDDGAEPLDAVFMLHPIGRDDDMEHEFAKRALDALSGLRVLCMAPNRDAGRAGIVRAIDEACDLNEQFTKAEHLDRPAFIARLKRLAGDGGALVGNSSAGLIECAAIGLGVVDLGDRQAGRERAGNVVHSDGASALVIREAFANARALSGTAIEHPYGDGRAGERVAKLLAEADFDDRPWRRKRNAY